MFKKTKFLTTALILYGLLLSSQVLAAEAVTPIYSMAVSGNVVLNKANSYARVILIDTLGKEYLVYEAQGPFDSGSFSFKNTCEETCVLNGIIPKKVSVEVSGATIHIDKLFLIEDKSSMNTQIQAMGMQSYAQALDPVQEDIKIKKMNGYIKKKGMEWTAGKTSVSSLSYADKKKLFGTTGPLPNTEGFEYYKGGVFETSDTKALPKSSSSSHLPLSFDWRNRHGKNWMTSVKFQGYYCGSCWVFAPVGAIEAVANLYFNQHLNLDLSEQDVLSCMENSTGCMAGHAHLVTAYFRDHGITIESCFPYQFEGGMPPNFDLICQQKCENWSSELVRGSQSFSSLINKTWKEKLIRGGPLVLYLSKMTHYVVLVGYKTNPADGSTEIIYKNSWGESQGEQGYRTEKQFADATPTDFNNVVNIQTPIKMSWNPNLKINCVDKDSDGYCNWGISDAGTDDTWRTNNCPASCKNHSEEDCDDSKSSLGPYDSNFNCTDISGENPNPTTDTTAPSVGKISPSSVKINEDKTFSALVSDNVGVTGCSLFIGGNNLGAMALSKTPCTSCSASKNHSFDSIGSYSAYAECKDEAGNTTDGSSIGIAVSSSAPSLHCSDFHTDTSESPPRCEKDCGADIKCDEKTPNAIYSSNNGICSWCDAYCRNYSDLNKECSTSVCTISIPGWDNSSCSSPNPVSNWEPCDPSGGWKCFDKKEGDGSCPGQRIEEGTSNLIYGYVPCKKRETAVSGTCKAKNKETIQTSASQIAMIPSSRIFNSFGQTITFEPRSSWHCKFKSGLFSYAKGCGWAKCEPGEVEGINNIKKIEFKVFRHFFWWYEVYGTEVFNQNTITWDGKGNGGKDLPNHLYTYAIVITLDNGTTYRTEDKITIQR